jgi:uncharacterized repeat protein (TIGR03803 family)
MKSRFVLVLLMMFSLAGLPSVFAQSSANVVYTFPLDGIAQSHYSHGAAPEAELIQGADGNFYGTTTYGGSGLCTNGSVVIGCGTIFMLTPGGVETVLFNFTYDAATNSSKNGIWPTAGLVQGKDGNFYGTASAGGANQAVCNTTDGCGTIFRITPGSKFKFKLLHQFCSNQCADKTIEGGQPRERLIQASVTRAAISTTARFTESQEPNSLLCTISTAATSAQPMVRKRSADWSKARTSTSRAL